MATIEERRAADAAEDQLLAELGPDRLNAIRQFTTYLSVRTKHRIEIFRNAAGMADYRLVPLADAELNDHWAGVVEDTQ